MFNSRFPIWSTTLIIFGVACLLLRNGGMAQTGPCATVVPGQALPDLVVDKERLKRDLLVSTEKFGHTDCAVVEGCVTSQGFHQLLRFSSSTPNIGPGELVIGDPNQCPNLFHQSECHNHLHFKEYADYRLWTDAGYQKWIQLRPPGIASNQEPVASLLSTALQNGELIVGRKQGFCIIDVEICHLEICPPPSSTQSKYQLCGSPDVAGNQGLQVGWTDIYGQSLDCQYIQMDKLPGGIYVLEDEVNAEHLLPESDYTNNSATVRFQFTPKKGNKEAFVTILPDL